jgi:hypothetical protein
MDPVFSPVSLKEQSAGLAWIPERSPVVQLERERDPSSDASWSAEASATAPMLRVPPPS